MGVILEAGTARETL